MPRKKTRANYGSGALVLRGKTWHCVVRSRSERRQVWKSTGCTDREEAQKFLNKKLLAAENQEQVQADIKDNPLEITYEQLRDQYLKEMIAGGKRSIRRGSLSNLGRVNRYFKNWKVADFSVIRLKEFRESCRKGKDGICDNTINRCMSAIRQMFKKALQNEMLKPEHVPGHFPMTKEPNEAKGAIYITSENYTALCGELQEPLRSAFVLAYWTGIRVGELMKLHWRDFDFKNRVINLPASITKNGRPRQIFIPPTDFNLKPGDPLSLAFPVVDARRQWQRVCVRLRLGTWICLLCDATCTGLNCPTHGRLSNKKIGYRGLYLRFARHSAVTNLDDMGLPENQIMAITGHETNAVFQRYHIKRAGQVANIRELAAKAHQKRLAAKSSSAEIAGSLASGIARMKRV